jgi:hypothetical protein
VGQELNVYQSPSAATCPPASSIRRALRRSLRHDQVSRPPP